MASANTVEIIFKATDRATAPINSMAQSVENLGKRIESGPLGAVGRLGAALGGLYAAGKVFDFLSSSVKEFMQAERGIRQMEAALETIGVPVEAFQAKVEAAIPALERMGTFDDDELREAFTNLVTLSGNAEASLSALPGVMNLAAARGLELAGAAELVGKAIEGNVVALQRVGVRFTDAQKKVFEFGTEADRAALIVGKLNDQFSGRAAADVDTYAGKIQRLKNELGDIKEDVGNVAVSFTDFGNVLKDVIERRLGPLSDLLEGIRSSGNLSARLFYGFTRGTAERPDDAYAGDGRSAVQRRAEDARAAEESVVNAGKLEAAEKRKKDAIRAATKAREDAIRAEQEYARSLDAMLNRGAAWEAQLKVLGAAVGALSQTIGRSAAIKAFAPELRAIGDQARKTASSLGLLVDEVRELGGMDLAKSLGTIPKFEIPKVKLDPNLVPDLLHGFREAAKEIEESTERATKAFEDSFKGPVKNIFMDLALTGGESFGEIAAQAMLNSVERGSDKLTAILSNAVLGAFGAEQAGAHEVKGSRAERERLERNAKQAQKLGQVFEAVIGTAGTLQKNMAGTVNDTELIIQTTLAGAQFGWIGAIVGLVVGVIGAAISSAGDNYPYARIRFADGKPDVMPEQNISQARAREMEQQLRASFDTFYNGYLKILMKFPMEILPNFLQTFDFEPRVGQKERPGTDFGRAASRMFFEDFRLYIEGGLPRELAGRFSTYFQEAFTGMGWTLDRFNEVWRDLEGLDPKKAMEMLGLLADATIAMRDAFSFFATPMEAAGSFLGGGLLQRVGMEANRTFVDQMQITDRQILRLSDNLANLTGEAQIQAAAEISRLVTERMEKERQFLQQINSTIEGIAKSFNAQIQDLEIEGLRTAEGAPDFQAQAQFLKDYADALRGQIATATSPQEAQALAQELQQVIMRIYGIGQQLGPEAGEEFRLWAKDALGEARDMLIARLQEIAEAVGNANQDFLDRITPAWEEFTQGVGDGFEDLRENFDGLSGATERVKDGFERLYHSMEPAPTGTYTKEGAPPVPPEIVRQVEVEPPEVVVPPISWDHFQAVAHAAAEEFAASLSTFGAGLLERRGELDAFGRALTGTATPLTGLSDTAQTATTALWRFGEELAGFEWPTVDAPTFDAPEFAAPKFEAPTFKAPTFEAPVFRAPVFEAPTFTPPIYEAPTFKAATFEVPEILAPPPPEIPPALEVPLPDLAAFDIFSESLKGASVAVGRFGETLSAFELPAFEWPTLEVPPFEWPVVEAPEFDAPTFEPPVFTAPTYDAPTFTAPTFEAPTFEAPIFKAPVFDAPTFTAPTFEAPTFEAPTFETPTFELPEPLQPPTLEPPPAPMPTVDISPVLTAWAEFITRTIPPLTALGDALTSTAARISAITFEVVPPETVPEPGDLTKLAAPEVVVPPAIVDLGSLDRLVALFEAFRADLMGALAGLREAIGQDRGEVPPVDFSVLLDGMAELVRQIAVSAAEPPEVRSEPLQIVKLGAPEITLPAPQIPTPIDEPPAPLWADFQRQIAELPALLAPPFAGLGIETDLLRERFGLLAESIAGPQRTEPPVPDTGGNQRAVTAELERQIQGAARETTQLDILAAIRAREANTAAAIRELRDVIKGGLHGELDVLVDGEVQTQVSLSKQVNARRVGRA